MTQECVGGLGEKTSQSVKADLNKDLCIISENLKTFRATTEATLSPTPTFTPGSKHLENVEKIRHPLEDMEKRIAEKELAKMKAPREAL